MKNNTDSSDYLIRLHDQSDEYLRGGRFIYASLSEEDFNKIKEILDIKEEDWE